MPIQLYWHRGNGKTDSGQENFGDYLSPLIVEAVSGKSVVYAEPKKADLFAVGSGLSREKKATRFGLKRKLHIWGSGSRSESQSFSGHHYYHALRGPLTWANVEGSENKARPVFGDPGLLARDIVTPAKSKPYDLGIIPHYADKDSSRYKAFANNMGNSKIIDVYDSLQNVLTQISQCRHIVSSSLHGIIIADAYGIPSLHTPFSSGLISEFKFYDYHQAINKPYRPFSSESVSNEKAMINAIEAQHTEIALDDITGALVKSFPQL